MLSVILLVVVCAANLLLAGVAYLSNTKSSLNRVFAALCLVLPVWSTIVFLEDYIHSPTVLSILVKADFVIAAVMVMLFYWFCTILTGFKSNILAVVLYITLLFIIFITAFGYTVTAIVAGDNLSFNYGPGYGLFLIYVVLGAGGGLIILISRHLHLTGKPRRQLVFINVGLGLSVVTLIAAEIIAPYLGYDSPAVTRAGIYGLLFFTAFSTYAVVKQRFLDVRKLVARSITYVLLLVTMAVGYAAMLLTITQLFFKDAGATLIQDGVMTALAMILAFTFQPLRRFFEHITSRFFYRDQYDTSIVLNGFSQVLVSELELNRILERSLKYLCQNIHIQFGQLVIFHQNQVYRIEHFGPLPKRLMIAPELHQLNQSIIVADELSGGTKKQLMDEHGVRVSLTLKTRDEFIGYILLGDKLSGDIYSAQDIKLLEIVAKQLAVAVLNAKAYAEIQEFNLTLQQKVDHATNRLKVANRHLKDLDKTKDEFISMASHQLRTPLTTIKGYLSMMIEGDAGKLTPTQTEFVDYAFGASERMVNLISDLLNVSRLSAGRFLIQATPTDVAAMVRDEVRQLQSHASAKNLALTFVEPPEQLAKAELDEGKTRQVIMNFIDNAIYYTPAGSVTVAVAPADDKVRVTVTDSGIGVPETAKKHLFGKFFRAENAQSVRPDGTGLGLYLAKRVVEDQGGTIIFNSAQGKGSTFGFELPYKATPAKKG